MIEDDLLALYTESSGLFHNLVAAACLDPATDFRRRDLRSLRFAGANLIGFDFTNSDLRGTGVRYATLVNRTTNFTNALLDSEDEEWRKNYYVYMDRIDPPHTIQVFSDCFGIDQFRLASASCLTFATNKLGQAPVFWGRYFKDPGNTSQGQYQANQEANFFNQHGIRVLPIGSQPANVSTPDSALGQRDGRDNAAAVISSFGPGHLSAMPEVAVFLDVERNNPLNHVYFQGWCAGLIDGGTGQGVRFVPCIYGHHNDGVTWSELGKAIGAGAVCGATWIIFMESTDFPIGPWKSQFTGKNMPSGVRVAITQRILDLKDEQGRTYDFDLINPSHQEWLLQRLVLPEPFQIG